MIVECWGLGLSAEETRTYIDRTKGVMMGLATVYRHRHSITAQHMIDELMRKQRRDIAKEDDSDLRMKYRDKLLEKLIPHRVESLQVQKIDQHVIIDATEDEDAILSKASRILTRKRKLDKIH